MSAAERDAQAIEEFEREAGFVLLGDTTLAGMPAWYIRLDHALGRMRTVSHGTRTASTSHAGRSVRLPYGFRLLLTPGYLPDVDARTICSMWQNMRPWRIRRGVQIFEAAASWMEKATSARRIATESDDIARAGIFSGKPSTHDIVGSDDRK